MPEAAVACAWCGAVVPDDGPAGGVPMTWMSSVERSGSSSVTLYYCPTCSRENVRAVEGKLDTGWW